MLSNKRLMVTKSFSKPGSIIHTADSSQFITLKCVRSSIDGEQLNIQDVADGDMFRVTVSEDTSIWISLKSVKDGLMLKGFPLEEGEIVRVSASQNILGKFLIFGYIEYAG